MLFVHCGCLPNRAIDCQNHTLSICQDVRACVPLSTDARHRALTPVAPSCASCHLWGGRWKWKDTEKRRGKQGGSHQKHRLDRKKIFLCISGILKVRRRREDWIKNTMLSYQRIHGNLIMFSIILLISDTCMLFYVWITFSRKKLHSCLRHRCCCHKDSCLEVKVLDIIAQTAPPSTI